MKVCDDVITDSPDWTISINITCVERPLGAETSTCRATAISLCWWKLIKFLSVGTVELDRPVERTIPSQQFINKTNQNPVSKRLEQFVCWSVLRKIHFPCFPFVRLLSMLQRTHIHLRPEICPKFVLVSQGCFMQTQGGGWDFSC